MVPSTGERSQGFLIAAMLSFVPLTVAWLAFLRDLASVGDFSVVSLFGWSVFIPFFVLGALGPVGLTIALRVIVRRHSISRSLGVVLIAGPLLMGFVVLIAFARPDGALLSVLRDAVLIGVLPAIGAAQMRASARPSAEELREG